MRSVKILSLFILCFTVVSCGTTKGVLYGAGTVLEGIAADVRTVGNWIR